MLFIVRSNLWVFFNENPAFAFKNNVIEIVKCENINAFFFGFLSISCAIITNLQKMLECIAIIIYVIYNEIEKSERAVAEFKYAFGLKAVKSARSKNANYCCGFRFCGRCSLPCCKMYKEKPESLANLIV